MNLQRVMLCSWFLGCLLNAPATCTRMALADEQPEKPLIVFLVRHAEKVDASRDPDLSAAGKVRAKELANALRSVNLSHVHSTDYIRTRDTAAPVAAAQGLSVELYDARDLKPLVLKLRETGGRHLVVGHSTTTPDMVKQLGGDAGSEIDEAAEYDRLYIVTVGETGQTTTVLLRYGEPFDK